MLLENLLKQLRENPIEIFMGQVEREKSHPLYFFLFLSESRNFKSSCSNMTKEKGIFLFLGSWKSGSIDLVSRFPQARYSVHRDINLWSSTPLYSPSG